MEKRRKGGILQKGSGREYYLHETNEKNARRENDRIIMNKKA